MRTSASTPVYHKVSRARTELNIFALAFLFVRWSAQFVACPSPGVYERHVERLINLSAQTVDVDFYQFGERVKGVVPDVFGDFFAPDNFSCVARQKLKQRVFFGRQFDGASTAPHMPSTRVYLKVTYFNDDRAQLLPAPQQCAQPCQKF